jgi:hypothetical protein
VGDATTWFVFISGYLFYYIEHKRFAYRDYLAKKVQYVLLPYFILSVPAISAGMYYGRHELLHLTPGAYAAWSLVVGGEVVGPLWFIPMITIFFIASWPLQRLARTGWIFPLCAVGVLISLFSSRPIAGLDPLLSFVHFFGFYLLGICAAKSLGGADQMLDRRTANAVIVAGASLFLLAAMFHDPSAKKPLGFIDGWGQFNLLQSGKLALLVAVFFGYEFYLKKPQKFLGFFAQLSFGLFFIHGFFMLLFSRLRPAMAMWSPWQSFVMEFCLVVLGSVAVVVSIKRVLGMKSRYVIGC